MRADAEAACILENTAPGPYQRRERTVRREHLHHLARTAGDADFDVVCDVPAFEDFCDRAYVAIRRIRARADHYLIDLHPGHGSDGDDVAGVVGRSGEGLEGGEVDREFIVVGAALVGEDFAPVAFAALGGEEAARSIIAREDARRHAELRAHIGYRRARGDVERGDGLSRVFKNPADVALGAEAFEHFEDDVLCAYARPHLANEAYGADARARDVERSAGHRHCNVDAACADRYLADAAARRRVGIRAQQRRAGLAETLEVQLVADAVAGLGIDYAVALGDGCEEIVVVGVFEADLHGIVVDIADGEVVLYVVDSHRLELQIRHRAGGVLRQGLVDLDCELCGVLRPGLFYDMRREYLLCDVHLFRFV